MTTSRSPLSKLKAQADRTAQLLKAFDRGEQIPHQFGEKLRAARGKPSVKFAIAMDDKLISIEMTWATIRATSEVGLAEYMLKQMRGDRATTH